MVEYALEIAGTEYPWLDLKYVRDYRFFGKLVEAIIPEWVAAIAGDDSIVIKRDGDTVTSGTVKLLAPFEGIGKGLGEVVTGYTKEMKHATLLANARTYNADPHDIIIDDLGSSDLSDGTTDAYSSNIVVEFGSNDESKFNRKMVYNEVAFITGWELYVNPTGALDFKSQCGVDRGATPAGTTVAFKRGELLESWIKPHTLNNLVKKTKVIVLGALEDKFEFYGIAGAGDDVYTIERKNLIDDNTCALAAAAVYADMQNTLKTGAMNIINTYSGAAFDVFDIVLVGDYQFSLDEDVRLYRIETHVDKSGEHTKIFYTNITKLNCNGPFLLDLANQHLETGQRVLRDYGRTAVNVLRGRPAKSGAPRFFKFQGEHEFGYDIWEAGGTIDVLKDKLVLTSPVNAPGEAHIQSAEMRTDFAKKPSLVMRFMINDLTDHTHRQETFGAVAGVGGVSAGCNIRDLELQSYTADAVDDETNVLLATMVEEQFYVVEIYVKTGRVDFYLDNVLTQTHTTRVPSSGLAPTLWANTFIGNDVHDAAFVLEFSHYEVNQDW